MAKLALNGGTPIRTKPYPDWPRGGVEEKQWLDKVLERNRWFAGLQGDDPEALGTLFGKRFGDTPLFPRLHRC
jgi:L-glutamine:scyllo-inosose aminotransferase/L-glutamine:2-deoxy-scyllo-inosose/3-amino-2,3-dideoxy-scyllo-inosose aminotransferase